MSIFLALPSYDFKLDARINNVIIAELGKAIRVTDARAWSWLPYNFNLSWCECLNRRREFGVHYFMMLHADIKPEFGFAEKMLKEMQSAGAQVLSAVSPFKRSSGLTSTALNIPEQSTRRLTLRAIAKLPKPFAIKDRQISDQRSTHLMTNTGLMIVDLNFIEALGQQRKRLHFAGRDWLVEDEQGKLTPKMFPEDWYFSKMAADLGGKVMATRKVKLSHIGQAEFPNSGEVGQETDRS